MTVGSLIASSTNDSHSSGALRKIRLSLLAEDATLDCVAAHHFYAKLGEALGVARRAGMVRLDTLRLRRETESQGDLEFLQRAHLPVEPIKRPWP